MQTYVTKQPTFMQVFQEALQLPVEDQLRLRDELAKLPGAKYVRPEANRALARAGRLLADKVRIELQNTADDSLDDAMRQLRGRAWSS